MMNKILRDLIDLEVIVYLDNILILRHFNPRLPMVFKTDMCHFAIRAILLQVDNGYLKPVAVYLRKINNANINYQIYEREILAIISVFKLWHHYLKGVTFIIKVYLNHKI
jgi:hypothetical protein